MATTQVRDVQEDFGGGMVRDIAPHLIPQNSVYDATNYILTDDGSLKKRGGTEYESDAGLGSTGLTFVWDGNLDVGRRTLIANLDSFGVMDGDTPVAFDNSDGLEGPVVTAEIEGLLFIGGGYIYAGSKKDDYYDTGTISVTQGLPTVSGAGTTWNTLVDAGMMLQIGNGRLYVVASIDGTGTLTLRDNYEGGSAAGQSYKLWHFYKITSADPYNASDTYAVSTNRLIWHTDNRVYFTDLRTTAPVANPHVTNTHDHHDQFDGSKVLGVAALGSGVLIFTTGGIWRMGGLAYDIVSAEGTPQHSVDLLTKDIILFGPAGMASWENFLIVPATDGVHLIDGVSTPVRISKNIDPLYQDYVQGAAHTGGAAVFRNNYLLPIIDIGETVSDVLVCRLDRAVTDRRRKVTFPWTHFDGTGAKVTAYAVRNSNDPRLPVLLGAEANETSRLLDASGYFAPGVGNTTDADGTTPLEEVTFRDFETGGLTENVVRRVRLSYELLDADETDPGYLLDYGGGVRLTGVPRYNDGEHFYNDGTLYSSRLGSEFVTARRNGDVDIAPETELTPHFFRINERFRHLRLRAYGNGMPSESSVIRRIEIFTRPSQALRR